MTSPAQFYIRVGLDDGSYPYLKAVMLPNGHVRSGYGINADLCVVSVEGLGEVPCERSPLIA